MSNNPLGCTCQLIKAVNTVRGAVAGGECKFPVATDGVSLSVTMETEATYFVNSNMTLFQCSKFLCLLVLVFL